MNIKFKELNNCDRVNVAKGLKNLYNLDYIKLDELIINFEERRLIVTNTKFTLMFDSVVCIDFTKYNK